MANALVGEFVQPSVSQSGSQSLSKRAGKAYCNVAGCAADKSAIQTRRGVVVVHLPTYLVISQHLSISADTGDRRVPCTRSARRYGDRCESSLLISE